MSFPRYPKYKPSGVEWLRDVPEHWEVKRLKHNLHLLTEKTARREHPVALENIEGWTGRFIPTETEFQGEGVAFDAGDILFGKLRPYLAKAYRATSSGEAVGDFHVLRPVAAIDSRFAQYQILNREFIAMVDGSTFGSKMPRASWEFVGGMQVTAPPLTEQTQIAAFLDRETAKIDELVAEQRRLMELLKEKRQAVISHAVTRGLNPKASMKPSDIEWLGEVPEHWKVVSLKHLVSTPITDGPHVSPTKLDEGFPFISAEAISQGFIDFDKIWGYVSPEDHEQFSKRYKSTCGDILMVKLGATTGTVAIVETDDQFSIWVPLAAIRPNKDTEPRFLLHVLRSDNLKRAYELNWTYGTQQTLGLRTITNLSIPVPPREEQQEIAKHIDSIVPSFEHLTTEAQRAINLLQERRTALISAAVTGQIDVREQAAVAVDLEKPYSSGFARQLLAAEILHHCHQHPTTGRVKLQKLIHLCEHIAEIEEVGAHYARKAAGPFDNKVMFGIASGLSKQKWLSETKDGARTIYRPLEKAGEHTKYLTRWEDKIPAINRVLKLLGKADTQQCEIVSTLYAAWNDLLIEDRKPTDAEIIHEASDPVRWHENKANIPVEKWPIALQWMKEKGIIPKGFGSHTSSKT